MSFYTIRFNNSKSTQLSEKELQSRLEKIGNLEGKKAAWIRFDLSIGPSNWFTRLIWTVVTKHFSWMRSHLYGVDLKRSQSALQQIKLQLPPKQEGKDSPLHDAFDQAVKNFNLIAPKHTFLNKNQEIQTYIHLVGDSTLDNSYWVNGPLQNQKNCVEGQLKELVRGQEVEIINHAVDGFTTQDVLTGNEIGAVLPRGAKRNAYIQAKKSVWQGKEIVKPLESLKTEIEMNSHARHVVVLSVGGNDFRVLLQNPGKMISEMPNIQRRYLRILDEIEKIQGVVQPILMTQYKTDVNDDHYGVYSAMEQIGKGKISPMQVFDNFLDRFYEPIKERAKKSRLPILDMARVFDPKDTGLYTCGIEPSEKGGEIIAKGIKRVVSEHNFQGPCEEYGKQNNQGKDNGS